MKVIFQLLALSAHSLNRGQYIVEQNYLNHNTLSSTRHLSTSARYFFELNMTSKQKMEHYDQRKENGQ